MDKQEIQNGPAFPFEDGEKYYPGMTLRDYFAAKVLQGWLAADIECGPDTAPAIAVNAYLMADAMLAERVK